MYYPNEAGKKLTGQMDEDYMLEHGYQILTRIGVYDEHYTRRLDVEESPGIKLVRSRENFKDLKLGMVEATTGKRQRLDLSGDCLYDQFTGDFLGGIVWCRDVSEYAEVITQQKEEIERGFENKLDNMPNLLFTAGSDGFVDYVS